MTYLGPRLKKMFPARWVARMMVSREVRRSFITISVSMNGSEKV